MKKRLKIVIIAVLLVLTGLLYGYYGLLYKPARDVSSETAAIKVTAQGLASEYGSNPIAADAKYLNVTIDVTGRVTTLRDSLVIIDERIACGFDGKPIGAEVNSRVTIKGRCLGYDELFEEVKLDQCTVK